MLPQRAVCEPSPQFIKDLALPVLDLAHLRRFTLGSVAFEREIMGLFAAGLNHTIAALDAAECAAQWHMAAHTLKGSAMGVGASRLAAVARDAEQMKYLSPAERGAVMSRIRAAIQEVLKETARLNLL